MPTSQTAPKIEEAPEIQELLDSARDSLEDGELARAAGRLDRALDLAQEDYAELFHLMAEVQAADGAQGEARTFAERAAGLDPGSVSVNYLLGTLLRSQDLPERAIEHLRTATLGAQREPDNPLATAAWFQLGEVLAESGYLTAAQEAYARFDRAIWEEHPEHREAAEVAAVLADRPRGLIDLRLDLLRRLGRTDDAVSAAIGGIRTRPGGSVPSETLRRRAARRRAGRGEFRLLPAAADG